MWALAGAIGFQALSTGMQVGAQREARRAALAAQYRSNMAEAGFLDDQAYQIEISGYRERFVRKIEGEEEIATQSLAFADNGVDIAGSALKQMSISSAKLETELNAMQYDTTFRASQVRKRAAAFREGALNAGGGGSMEDAATILSGAAKIGTTLYDYFGPTKSKE